LASGGSHGFEANAFQSGERFNINFTRFASGAHVLKNGIPKNIHLMTMEMASSPQKLWAARIAELSAVAFFKQHNGFWQAFASGAIQLSQIHN
jgi:hypothetical protein